MFPTEFDLWLRMEKVVIRVETVTDLMSNFWIIHFKYLLPRMVTGQRKIESQWAEKMDGLKSVFFICMVPVLYTDRIGLGTAPLWGKIYKDSSALICSFAPSREMRWLGHREELRGSQEMGSFSGLSEIILCGGISQ